MMNEHGKSDSLVVPEKLPNKAEEAAEVMEGRGLAKGNLIQRNAHRTQSRGSVHSGLERVREAVKRDKSSLSTDPFLRLYPR
jgi:RNA-directed DNA polymerase